MQFTRLIIYDQKQPDYLQKKPSAKNEPKYLHYGVLKVCQITHAMAPSVQCSTEVAAAGLLVDMRSCWALGNCL